MVPLPAGVLSKLRIRSPGALVLAAGYVRADVRMLSPLCR